MRAGMLAATAAVLLALAPPAPAAPPTCGTPAEQSTREGRVLDVWLGEFCQDPDGDELTYQIAASPGHGTLSGPDPFDDVQYTPGPGFVGDDSFSFTAHAAQDATGPITVPIAVTPNRPPFCATPVQHVVDPSPAPYEEPIFIYDVCDDLDFDDLAATVVERPQHGSATADEDGLLYVAAPGYSGPDSFTFRVSDDLLAESNVVTVEVTVRAPNRPPTCLPAISLSVEPGGSLPLDHNIACSDPDGHAIYAALVDGPSHGTLSFPTAVVHYTPHAGFVGTDQIRFYVQDERGADSNVSTLTITVGDSPTPTPPAARKTDDRVAPRIGVTSVAGQKLRRLRAKGLTVVLRTNEAGVARLTLTVARKAARRLGLKRRRVGSLERSIPAGSTTLTIRLAPAARAALRSSRRVKLRLLALVTDAAGNGSERARTVRLRG